MPRESARARELTSEAVEIARSIGDRYTLALALNKFGWLAMDAGESAEAQRVLEQNLPLWRELNDLFTENTTLQRLAMLAMDAARFADALALWERCTAIYRLLGSSTEQAAKTLHEVAISARLAGNVNRAIEACDESLTLYQSLGKQLEVAAVTASLGHLHRQRGATAMAAVAFAESLRTFRSLDSDLFVAIPLTGLGGIAFDERRRALVRRWNSVHVSELQVAGRPAFAAERIG